MIDFKYDILFGLLFWSIKDVPRTANYFSVSHMEPITRRTSSHHLETAYTRTQNN
jgi:hypothetical protein